MAKTMVSHDGMSEIIWTPGRAYWRCYEQDKGHFRYVAELSPEFPEWVNRSGRVVDRTKAVNYSTQRVNHIPQRTTATSSRDVSVLTTLRNVAAKLSAYQEQQRHQPDPDVHTRKQRLDINYHLVIDSYTDRFETSSFRAPSEEWTKLYLTDSLGKYKYTSSWDLNPKRISATCSKSQRKPASRDRQREKFYRRAHPTIVCSQLLSMTVQHHPPAASTSNRGNHMRQSTPSEHCSASGCGPLATDTHHPDATGMSTVRSPKRKRHTHNDYHVHQAHARRPHKYAVAN